MMERMLKYFDQWDFTPSFTISKAQPQFKLQFSGFIFLTYSIFAIAFFAQQLTEFFLNLNTVSSCRFVQENLSDFTFTVNDVYFGFGLLVKDKNGVLNSIPNNTFFSMFELKFENLQNVSVAPLKFENCSPDLFFDSDDWLAIDSDSRVQLNNTIKNFYCPSQDFSIYLENTNFLQQVSSFRITLSLRPENVSEAISFLMNNQVKAQVLYSNIFINAWNKLNPFDTFIDFENINVDAQIIKKVSFNLILTDVYDDLSRLSKIDYSNIKKASEYSLLGNYFFVEPFYENIEYVNNRTLSSNTLVKIDFVLNPTTKALYRDFNKFTTYLAGTNSIISSVYLIVSVIIRSIKRKYFEILLVHKFLFRKQITRLIEESESTSLHSSNRESNRFTRSKQGPGKHGLNKGEFPKLEHFEIITSNHREGKAYPLAVTLENLFKTFNEKYFIPDITFFKLFGCVSEKKLSNYDEALGEVLKTLKLQNYFSLQADVHLLKKILLCSDQSQALECIKILLGSTLNLGKKNSLSYRNTKEHLESLNKIFQSTEDTNQRLANLLVT